MSEIAQVRSFNRLVARGIGALNDRFLGHRPLGECRVLFEIGARGATSRDVRTRLALDSGYLSRMLRALERDGLVEIRPGSDRRTKWLVLTSRGRAEIAELDRLADEHAAATLAPLDDAQRSQLLRAQREVQRLLAVSLTTIAREDPASADARWCLDHYFAELHERFGLDRSKTLPSDGGLLLLARLQQQPAACGVLKDGEIMRMWVDRPHRGLGLSARMLSALEDEARAQELETVRLYTNGSLTEARALYGSRGYTEIPRYNDDPYAQHWFEKRL
jgi:DNA-binding MarR family transcriptional regulator